MVVVFVMAPVIGAFLWTADGQLRQVLLRTGGQRAQATADQIADLMAQNTSRGLAQIRRIAGDPVVRRALIVHDDESREAARRALGPLAAAGQPPVVLTDAAGNAVVTVAVPGGVPPDPAPPGAQQPPPGVGPFFKAGGAPSSQIVAEVVDAADGAPVRIGSLVVTRRLSSAPNAALISSLVGDGARVAMGSGDVWTDFSTIVEAPPIDTDHRGVSEYRRADGDVRLGAVAPISGTPWAVMVDFPESRLLAPARGVLARTGLVALLFLALAVGLAAAAASRLGAPLRALAAASDAIAAGDYSARIDPPPSGEFGAVSRAFNTMAGRIEHTRQGLEASVTQRTARLEATTRELDRFFSVSIDLFCIADFDGRFRRVNRAWRDVLGWEPEELTSRPYAEFVHPDDRDATTVEAERLAGGQRVISFENRYRHKDGSYRWLRWVSAPAPEEGLIYASARDVTREREIARELETRVKQLDEANQELESFSYSVSHDLRAPLRHITGFAALLERSAGGELRETDRRYLQTITTAAKRMGALIDDLLSFSRMGRASLSRQRVDLGALVEDAWREVVADVNGRALEWVRHDLPVVTGDHDMLRVVFVNLLSNAVKYSAPRAHARVEVGAEIEDATARIFVRDNGVGFDPQYAHKLFGVFQRLHSSDDFEGTGIGLATVRRIVRRHGGDVWAESAPDRGATFHVSLPRTAPGEHA
jgi:PAS domain S-box-containing protein